MEINQLKSLLSHYGIRPNKDLGQNFLLSEEVLHQIVDAAQLTEGDTVLEIGPGLGFLTRKLADKASQVIAIEKDKKLCQALHKMFKNKKNVKIINGDALDPSLFPSPHEGRVGEGYKVVANIPYYLTGKILKELLSPTHLLPSPDEGRVAGGREGLIRPDLIVFLLQKEVAQRIVAGPGEMSLLSLSVQFYADPEIIAYVPKENFYPVPEVDSAIVRIRPHPAPSPFIPLPQGEGGRRPGEGVDEAKFFQLLKIAFSNKRKQLHNNLQALPVFSPPRPAFVATSAEWAEGEMKRGLTSPSPSSRGGEQKRDYKTLLSSLDLNPLARAQDLSLEDWENLYDKIFPAES
ncbi:MAG: 16S rRNA (adenine(1518)-N(6)/adenine(1519)-N(6))-dimethyltransferase RsmA [bacterium]|nr:16S rRNA (adenine(1518)-N(6)/adenine(1519)-N(6))-dimethyltransferase RsmA [bacterium]